MSFKNALLNLILHTLINCIQGQDTLIQREVSSRFGVQFDAQFSELQDLHSWDTHAWLESQDKLKKSLLGRKSTKRLNNHYYFHNMGRLYMQFYESFSEFELLLALFEDDPATLEYKPNDGKKHLLVDGKDFRLTDFDLPSIEEFWVSPDEKFVIVGLGHSGHDRIQFLVIDLIDLKYLYTLSGVVTPWIVFREDGFFYETYENWFNPLTDQPFGQKISFHKFNTTQEEDEIVFMSSDRDGSRPFYFFEDTENDRLFIHHQFKRNDDWLNALSVLNLQEELIIPRTFLTYFSDYIVDFDPVRLDSDTVRFRTNFKAMNYHIMDFNVDSLNQFEVFQEESLQILVDAVHLDQETYGMTYYEDGRYFGYVQSESESVLIDVPDGEIIEFESGDDGFGEFRLSSYYLRPEKYTIDLKTLEYKRSYDANVFIDLEIITEIVYYSNSSNDKLPMTLIYSSESASPRPTLLEVYSGYGFHGKPSFEWENYFIVKNGGMIALPVTRGGGELGLINEHAGKGSNKANTISDVIHASRFLIDSGYTTSDQLILEGGSHGAFVVTAAAIEQPELFSGVIAISSPMDLLIKNDFGTRMMEINLQEFGNPNDSIDFLNLRRLSPIHNLQSGIHYPSFLLMVGLNDLRVPAWNSLRFKAQLDECSTNELNVLHYTNGGHSVANYPNQYKQMVSLKLQFIKELTGFKFWR